MNNRAVGAILGACLCAVAAPTSCERPALRVTGARPTGFGSTSADTIYLLNRFSSSYEGSIAWPPEDFARTIDISFDVTGSMFKYRVATQDSVVSLAQHDLRLLRHHLANEIRLAAGDVVRVRLFGANLRGQRIEARSDTTFRLPQASLSVRASVTSRGDKRVDLRVLGFSDSTDSLQSRLADAVAGWISGRLTPSSPLEGPYLSSPLLEHIRRVRDLYSTWTGRAPLHLVFVTDGLIEFGKWRYYPSAVLHAESAFGKLRTMDEVHRLRPFTGADSGHQFRLTVLGVFDESNEDFGQAQRAFLRWFFEPAPVSVVRY